MVFENGLLLLKSFMDAKPELLVALGTYVNSVEPVVGANMNYGQYKFLQVKRGDFNALVNNFIHCDGFPLLRAEAFQRHCGFYERGFGLFTLFSRLLSFGDVLFIDQPIYQHFINPDSLSTKMSEPSFHDAYDADIEIAFASMPEPLPGETLDRVRKEFNKIIYLQAARMCRMRQEYMLMWQFLMRAKVVGVAEATLVECEEEFLLKVALRQLAQLFGDIGASKVCVENTPLMLALKSELQTIAPATEFLVGTGGMAEAAAGAAEVWLVERFDKAGPGAPAGPKIVAFYDVLDNMRLTGRSITAAAADGAIKLTASGPHEDTSAFGIFMSDWGAPMDPRYVKNRSSNYAAVGS